MMNTSQEEFTTSHGLIVDFPCQPKVTITPKDKDTMSSAPALSPRPRVRFSEYSQLSVIPKDDTKSKCFSRQEQRLFRQAVLADTLRLRNLFQNTSPEMITQDDLYECVGIESYLSQDLARHVVQKKRAHVDAVLSAQRANRGACSNEKISHTSKHTSRWARKRAEKLAKGYATQLRD
mmetsp:Transcript_17023/g.27658  ORF Transcript_17023/g.27658 Transcript_17023/m.27658 type:complete len:178 (-) Transcript_17023:179-712(-)